MHRIFPLLIMSLFLSACGSDETKIKAIVHEGLKEKYNITETKILSLEEQRPAIPFIESFFDGKTYQVKIEVNDSVSTVIHAKVNRRKREFKSDDYIERKHEKLINESNSYQKGLSELRQLDVKDFKVTDGYYQRVDKEGNVIIRFELEMENTLFSGKKIVELIEDLSEAILEDIGAAMEVQLDLPTLSYSAFQSENGDYQYKYKADNLYKQMRVDQEAKVPEQLQEIGLATLLNERWDEQLTEEIERFGVHLLHSAVKERFQEVHPTFFHEILFEGDEVSAEAILELMDYLRKKGFHESYVRFFDPVIYEERYCKVEDMQTVEDILSCV